MANPNISAALTTAQKTTIPTNINAIIALLPFLVNLDPATRQSLRKTGTKREGYVSETYDATTANPTAFPATFSIAEWTKDETLNTDLKLILQWLSPLFEGIDDTILALGGERIKQADSAYAYLKQAAEDNASLSNVVASISRAFAGKGRTGHVPVFTVPAGGLVTLDKIVAGSLFTNLGTTNLSISNPSGVPAALVVVGSSLAIAPVFTPIVVVHNESAAAAGSFSIT